MKEVFQEDSSFQRGSYILPVQDKLFLEGMQMLSGCMQINLLVPSGCERL